MFLLVPGNKSAPTGMTTVMPGNALGAADTPFENNTKMYRVVGMPSFYPSFVFPIPTYFPPGPYFPLANPENAAQVLHSVTTFGTLVYRVVTFNVGDWVAVRGSFSSVTRPHFVRRQK